MWLRSDDIDWSLHRRDWVYLLNEDQPGTQLNPGYDFGPTINGLT